MYFRHYKGGEYYLLDITRSGVNKKRAKKYLIATHTETNEEMKVYMYDGAFHVESSDTFVLYIDANGRYWLRPLGMFFEMVEVDGKEVPRFYPIYRYS
jgi:hypothetical protein